MTQPLTPPLKSTDRTFCRRHIVKLGLLALAVGATPPVALAHRPSSTPPERSLDLYHTHTGERLKTVYWAAGQYLPEALAQLNHLLRDYRTDDIRHIDPRLLDFLHALAKQVEASYPFHIVSAYRSPTTNAHLRQHRLGVAKRSFHMYGKAIDFYLPKRALAVVQRAALRLRQGGIGYYPNAHFLHLDTGPVRSWKSAD
jgi:uncharacterized protein YcbK (DUF882 family)